MENKISEAANKFGAEYILCRTLRMQTFELQRMLAESFQAGLDHADALKTDTPAPEFGEFMECVACAAMPGTPPLCPGCLHNRDLIGKLKEYIKGT